MVKDETETFPITTVVSPPTKTIRWICYYCGKKGHIRHFCFKLQRDKMCQREVEYGSLKHKLTFKNWNRGKRSRMVWRVKLSEHYNIAFTIAQATNDAWYFDSGCSRHMTGNKSFFSELKECALSHVTFENGASGRIIAKENIDKNNLHCLNIVRYVDGLKANLISVSQLCDQGYSVNFSKASGVVVDEDNHVFMGGSRQADNCYHWSLNNSDICHSTKEDQTWLWNRNEAY